MGSARLCSSRPTVNIPRHSATIPDELVGWFDLGTAELDFGDHVGIASIERDGTYHEEWCPPDDWHCPQVHGQIFNWDGFSGRLLRLNPCCRTGDIRLTPDRARIEF